LQHTVLDIAAPAEFREGIALESDPQVFELTHRNLIVLSQRVTLVRGDYEGPLPQQHVPEDRGIVAFVAPPWGSALDEVEGLDLRRTAPPIAQVIEHITRQFQTQKILFATQVYEKVSTTSLARGFSTN
jgi:hypothetical protein